MPSKEVKELIHKLQSQGFKCIASKKNHIKVYKDGEFVATLPSTPSDKNSLKHVLRYLKQAGFR